MVLLSEERQGPGGPPSSVSLQRERRGAMHKIDLFEHQPVEPGIALIFPLVAEA